MSAPTRTEPGLRVEELRGFRVGVTSDRRSEDLVAALQRRGAQVLHAPALRIVPHEQDAALVEETRALIRARPEVVLLTTGYGVRRWFEVADAAGLGAALTAVLDDAQIFARGPKAVGAVRAAGLLDVQTSEIDTTAALVDAITGHGLGGRRVAIQLHGSTDHDALRRLADVSAEVLTVTPYRWVRPSGDRLLRLVEATCSRQLDAITYTSAPGAAATLEAARAAGLGPEFVRAHREHVTAAAVGPVTAQPLLDAGIVPVVPERHRLGALIRLVCDDLARHHVQVYRAHDTLVEVRGRSVSVGGRNVLLGPNALVLFKTLAAGRGVVPRSELVAALPDPLDDHALEVAMSRLRRTLDLPGLITTVVRRGYRFTGVRVDVPA
ncbi:uroporphyrinogen-III synthase [Microlunatus sagamiharensis]|uniref:Uroporphyrinogen-III synthase n=1 Tax=Microlunatus sagamiharensis TaxID=546874 RepID=A0A1H2M7X2_9ACTN|nr:uroporphyrinogen-III synthase [Microlunatus sagamiharensis]SDU89259.1 uroporphyrinogen-III synthase [Microlunatus sagamiharensis]